MACCARGAARSGVARSRRWRFGPRVVGGDGAFPERTACPSPSRAGTGVVNSGGELLVVARRTLCLPQFLGGLDEYLFAFSMGVCDPVTSNPKPVGLSARTIEELHLEHLG